MKKSMSILTILVLITSITSAQKFKEVEKTFTIEPTGSVSVDTYKGSIKVETWDKNEVYIHAKVEADTNGWDSTDPDEQLERCEIRFNSSDNWVEVKSDYNKSNSWFGSNTLALVHYTIKMPKTAELVVDDYKSVTNISNLNSKIRLETYKGEVKIKDFSGSVKLETYKGDIEIGFTDLTGDSKFETYKGKIELYLNRSESFSLDLDLGKKGDYSSDFTLDESSSRRHWRRDEVRGDVNGGGPYIEFSTYKGEIRISAD